MNTKKLKKLLILNVPYFLVGAFATNLGEAWRIADGSNMSEKVQGLVIGGGFSEAFSNILPSIHPLIWLWVSALEQAFVLQYI